MKDFIKNKLSVRETFNEYERYTGVRNGIGATLDYILDEDSRVLHQINLEFCPTSNGYTRVEFSVWNRNPKMVIYEFSDDKYVKGNIIETLLSRGERFYDFFLRYTEKMYKDKDIVNKTPKEAEG